MALKPKINTLRKKHLDKLGDEEVFSLYLEHGSVRKTVAWLSKNYEVWEPAEEGQKTGMTAFYKWLHDNDERWRAWKNLKRFKGDLAAEDAVEHAMNATQEDWQVSRLKYDAKKWEAGVLNREEYGDGGQQAIQSLGQALLAAMMKADEVADQRRLEASNPTEAEWEVEEG